jgi:ATP-dependent protease HslVU (ClpYQ) ATPase subunit
MAYRHVRRLKRLFLEGAERDEVMPKSTYLLIGPTGCGKTHLVELLFGSIL